MKKIRLFLNIADRSVNVLFDNATKLRLTLQKPYGEVDTLTRGLKASIKAGKVIDIDGVSGIEVSDVMKEIHNRVLIIAGIKRETTKEVVEPKEVKEEEKEVKEVKETKSSKSKSSKAKKETKEEEVQE